MKRENIELTQFIISAVFVILSLIFIFSGNGNECPRDSGTPLSLIVGIACRYGIIGISVFLIAVILISHLLIKYAKQGK
jgi:hypothetical protein